MRIKSKILRWLVSSILNAVTIDDLLRIENGELFVGKRKLSEKEVAILKTEAKQFEGSLLWRLMLNNLYWIANYKMIKGADRERDMDNGRMMTLVIETLQEFIEKLKIIR